jgi:uncharacterized sulfatase
MLDRFEKSAVVCTFLLMLAASGLQAADKLNVLLIISDDLRDTVGCYGNTQAKTPNLDRLAARGIRFDRAYVQYPVCNPSRTSFLTGMRCQQTGVVDNKTLFRSRLPDSVTFPQLLKENGWHTVAFGKIFHAGGGRRAERQRWMDLGKSWDEARLFDPTPAGRVIEGRNISDGKLNWCQWGATAGDDDDQPDGQTARHSAEAIEKLTADGKPWMVAAGFHRPHDPFFSPKKYFDLYPPGSLELHHDPVNATPLRPLSLARGDMLDAFNVFTDKDRREFLRAYYAGVSFMDAQVGRLLDVMDRMKLWDRTLVIFIGDHGYHHNERGWWSKNTLFERSCRVPCIVAAPDAKGAQVCGALVELVDLYPTVCDYCGVKAPHELVGQSLRPLLEVPSSKGKNAAFTLVTRGPHRNGQAVRTDRWRYIWWNDGYAELYDERNDPQEMKNLADDPVKRTVIDEHKALLQQIGEFE